MIVYLVCGKRYGGKDYCSSEYCDAAIAQGETAVCRAFACKAKEEFCAKEGLDFEKMMNDRNYKEEHREALIAFAEGEKDTRGATIWAQLLFNEFIEPESHVDHLYITDWRLPEECEYAKLWCESREIELITMRKSAMESTRKRRGWQFNEAVDTHRTECALDQCKVDRIIVENGSLSGGLGAHAFDGE